MINDIPKKQNEQTQLNRLAAQRNNYSEAKLVQLFQLIITIPGTVLFSIVVLLNPSFAVWQALFGLFAVLVELPLKIYQTSLKRQAAKIQELFDCEVLQLEWNYLGIGAKPDVETIIESSDKIKRTKLNIDLLKNWYSPSVVELPIHLARIICQRTNLRWDSQLRRWYSKRALAVSFGVIGLLFLFSLLNQISFVRFVLTVLTPSIPVFLWGFKEYRDHSEVAEEQERFKSYIEEFWQDAITSKLSEHQILIRSRELQDEIFILRRDNPLIFDQIYRYFKSKYEIYASQGAEELVKEALENIYHGKLY